MRHDERNETPRSVAETLAAEHLSRERFRWPLRLPIAALLLVAAIAKIVNAPQILAGDGLLASRTTLLSVMAFETAAGAFLLLGDPFRAWLLALATFSVFALASGYALATGQDCNCVGQAIGPDIMLSLDLAVLVLVIWRHPRRDTTATNLIDRVSTGRRSPLGGLKIGTVTGVSCLVIGGVAATAGAVRLETTANDIGVDYMFAEHLVGRTWPIDSSIHPELKPLESGRWVVVVLRSDCYHCNG